MCLYVCLCSSLSRYQFVCGSLHLSLVTIAQWSEHSFTSSIDGSHDLICPAVTVGGVEANDNAEFPAVGDDSSEAMETVDTVLTNTVAYPLGVE